MARRRFAGIMESLESRRMLSASVRLLDDGTLLVKGTRHNDRIELRMGPGHTTHERSAPVLDMSVIVSINGEDYADMTGVLGILVHCGRGNDRVESVTFFPTTIMGGRGNDTIIGGQSDDVIYGQGGADSLSGGGGDDKIFGGSGGDRITGGANNDLLIGGGGNDSIMSDTADTVHGGRGVDQITEEQALPHYEIDANGLLTIFGTEDDDEIVVHYVGRDNGWILVTDPYYILEVNQQFSSQIRAAGVKGIRILGGNGDDNIAAGYEGMIIDASETDVPVTLLGEGGDDTLVGADGNDSLDGGDGDDELAGSAGDDVLLGGAGDDTLRGNPGSDLVHGGDGDDAVGGLGHLIRGVPDGVDSVFGDAGNDVFMTVGDTPDEHKDRAPGEATSDRLLFSPKSGRTLPPGMNIA